MRAKGRLVCAALFVACPAAANVPFVERPLTLTPGQVSADVGIGFAQAEYGPNEGALGAPGYHVGWGGDVEGAVGLPYVGQLGLRVGYRPDEAGRYAYADAFGRVLDPLHLTLGSAVVTGPELDWRKTLFTPSVVEIGLDARLLTDSYAGLHFAADLGVPVRIHLSRSIRLDTGIYFASVLETPVNVSAQIPAQLFFQIGDTFLGPEVELISDRYSLLRPLPFGFGVGHTFGGVVDVKAEALATDIGRPEHTLTGGVGVGVRL